MRVEISAARQSSGLLLEIDEWLIMKPGTELALGGSK